MDEGGDDKARAELERGQNFDQGARKERFEFLGYSFGPHYWWKNGQRSLGASPSKTSVQRIRVKISALLVPGNKASWPQVRDQLNRLLSGWSAYFSHGTLGRYTGPLTPTFMTACRTSFADDTM